MGINKIKDICQKQDGFIPTILTLKIIAAFGPINIAEADDIVRAKLTFSWQTNQTLDSPT